MFQPVSVLFLNNSINVPVEVIYKDQFLCVTPVSLATIALLPLLFNILNQAEIVKLSVICNSVELPPFT
jgi:hypothetical protein